MITAVDQVIQSGPVPKAHQTEGKKKPQVRSDLVVLKPFVLHRGEEKSHVNVVAKPERKRDIPSRPEIANVVGKERAIEIFRGVHSKQSTEGDRECRVTGEIKKQIETVAIHVGQILAERSSASPEPANND